MPKEIINLQIGQCGIQLGHEFWKQICFEHRINPDGYKNFIKNERSWEEDSPFFYCSSREKRFPRAILFDLEPRIVSTLLNSTFGDLYERENILAEKQGSGNNWANGYHRAIDYQTEIQEVLRKESEKCNNLGSFNIFHSTMGGTGSGSGSLIMEIIKEEFPGKFLNCFSIVPNQFEISDVVVQPYNSILSLRWLSLYGDCVTFFENDSVQKIIDSKEREKKNSLLQINALIAKVLSTITLPVRFTNYLTLEFEGLFAPLIPTPNLHFLFAGISGCSFPGVKTQQGSWSSKNAKQILTNKTINSNFKKGKLISSLTCLHDEVDKNDIPKLFKNTFVEKGIKSINWSPVSMQFSFHNQIKTLKKKFHKDVTLFNHTCIKNLLKRTLLHYDMLKRRNAFLDGYLKEFHLGEALELFDDARDTTFNLWKDYCRAESTNYL